MSIPFNKPIISDAEIGYVIDALGSPQISGDGKYTKRVHALLEQEYGCPRALLTHSCTAALEMAAILLDIAPGDEVIMPTFTFVSTANAVVLRGGVPVFVDIDAQEFNILPSRIEAAITPRTKAVFVVHYAGVACDMDSIVELCERHGLALVEDAAQAYGASFKGQRLGTFGAMSTLSFHETKNIISGEGGALIINDARYVDRAEVIREKGTDRSQFHRGIVDKYTWRDVGSSYLPSDIIAALLLAQLERSDAITTDRLTAWHKYQNAFAPLSPEFFRVPQPSSEKQHNGHIFYLLTNSLTERASLIQWMASRQIMTPFHYVPLHNSPAGLRFARAHGDLSTAMDIADRLVRLPLFPGVADVQDAIITAVLDWVSAGQ